MGRKICTPPRACCGCAGRSSNDLQALVAARIVLHCAREHARARTSSTPDLPPAAAARSASERRMRASRATRASAAPCDCIQHNTRLDGMTWCTAANRPVWHTLAPAVYDNDERGSTPTALLLLQALMQLWPLDLRGQPRQQQQQQRCRRVSGSAAAVQRAPRKKELLLLLLLLFLLFELPGQRAPRDTGSRGACCAVRRQRVKSRSDQQ
jgi:hypothetical protein